MSPKPKKLSARARSKEATGIQVEAAKGRDRKLEAKVKEHQKWVKDQIRMIDVNLECLWKRVLALEGHKK